MTKSNICHIFVVFQDFRNGKVDTAFIPKHEEELAMVRTQYNLENINVPNNGFKNYFRC